MSTVLISQVFSGIGIRSANLAFTIARNTGGVVLQVNTNPALMTLDGNLVVKGVISQIFPGTGSCNTAYGLNALISLTSGSNNAAFGEDSLATITTTSDNTAVGCSALEFGTGADNSAVGWNALRGASVATPNSGNSNNAFGAGALIAVTTGSNNVGIGNTALPALTTGINNVAVGNNALPALTAGAGNVAIGYFTLLNITTGINNTAIGSNAGDSLSATDSNNICINNLGVSGDALTVRIGTQGQNSSNYRTFLAGPITQGGGITTATTLIDQQSGTVFSVAQDGVGYVITLPTGAGNIAGRSYEFALSVAAAGTVTVNAPGAETFLGTIVADTAVAVSGVSNINFVGGASVVGDNVLIKGISETLWMVRACASTDAGITAT